MAAPSTVSELAAMRRLRNIVATACPSLSPVATAGPKSFAEMEGAVLARSGGYKVAMYIIGDRGVPLASRPQVEAGFHKGSLEVSWAASIDDLDEDTHIIVTTGAPIGADVLKKCPKLSLVAVAFTGTDHVDLSACRANGVTVINTPAYSTDSTAQLAIGLTLEHLNNLPACHASIQAGGWQCPPQDDLRAKNIGIIGTGDLGGRCAELFKAFKVKSITGYDTVHSQQFLACGGTYLSSLAAVVLEADIVVVCLPLTEQTRGLISARILQLLRPDSILVNVGRGEVIDEPVMASLLKEGRFRAALDVFGKEPLPTNDALRSVPSDRLLMTPHVGYQSNTSLEKRFDATVKNILAFLAGHAINIIV